YEPECVHKKTLRNIQALCITSLQRNRNSITPMHKSPATDIHIICS
ncbi:hypothetical protein GBAR_LOCUS27049, partial [Geodia barretti]